MARAGRRVQAEEARLRSGDLHHFKRDLKLTHDRVGFTQVEIVGLQPAVGPWRDDDHVVAAGLDEDQCHAALPVITDHAADVDPLALE